MTEDRRRRTEDRVRRKTTGLFLLVGILLPFSSSFAATTNQISQYGITWTFDKDYEYGQFANGDYWVVGPIKLLGITPDAAVGRNGWEVNPNSHDNQPYDDRVGYYTASLQPGLPATIQPTASVVKTISLTDAEAAAYSNHVYVKTAAVLTVVSSAPPGNGASVFRPPYYGTNRPYYYVSDMNLSALPSLAPVAGAPTLDWVTQRFQKVQLDHKQYDSGRTMHPVDSMPNYGADIARDNTDGALRLMLNDPLSAKQQAAINYVQMGIDLYHDLITGQIWPASGGQQNGRKLPILFAGIVLNNQAMRDAVQKAPHNTFSEEGLLHFSQQANNGNGLTLWGIDVSINNKELIYWTELANPGTGSKTATDPYGYIDGGYRIPSDYQGCCTSAPLKDISIAARLLPNGVALWNDNHFFDYVDRWATVGGWAQPDPCAPYDGVWSNYGITFGPDGQGSCIKDTNPSDGIGRFPNLHGTDKNGRGYGSTFAENMWKAYRDLTHCSNGVQDADETGIDCGGSCPFGCPTDWKSGISVIFQGTPGKDYAEEYYYHDKLIDDHKVVYIKDSTPIILEHNDRNSNSTNNGFSTVVGKYGLNGVPDDVTKCLQDYPNINSQSCDDGIIRYRVDRDLQNKYYWGVGKSFSSLYPAYQMPMTFVSLNYGPEDPGVSVVGTTGPKPGIDITNKKEFYYRGIADAFGDEWHSLSYADDDQWQQSYYVETEASDGKTALFVLNPKTPLIYFETTAADAQFYTTPPKANFIPVIHDQTTYLTDGVDIKFVNIMNTNPVYYRIDDGVFSVYQNPINSASLSEGVHTVEYYYDASYPKVRKIVKNPPYPSDTDIFSHDGSSHGYLLWRNEQKFNELKERLLSGSLKSQYASTRDDHGQWGGMGWNIVDQVYRQGLRRGAGFALANALVVTMEGADARPQHAAYAKKALLDSQLNIDPVGTEVPTGMTPNPSREMYFHGYYAVNAVYDKAFAYDLLIKNFKSSEHAGGITPVEDYKMRDLLASHNIEMMKWMGGYSASSQTAPNLGPSNGMWDFAQYTGADIAAMAMPSYHTPYYGTSGYNGTQASYPWTPYPDHPASWKDAFYTYTDKQNPSHVAKIYGYPNQQRMFNHLDGGLITKTPTPVNRTLTDGTVVTEIPAGAFYDRSGYYSFGLMGHTFECFAMVNKIKLDATYPWLEKSFQNANEGTLYGLKINDSSDLDPQHYWQYLLINEYFPNIASGAEAYLPQSPEQRFEYLTSPYGLIWHNPDWRNYLTVYGDVSQDGEVSAYDAALVAQASVGLITLTVDQTKAADVSGDSEVTAYDAALIAQRAVGLIDKFPVEPL